MKSLVGRIKSLTEVEKNYSIMAKNYSTITILQEVMVILGSKIEPRRKLEKINEILVKDTANFQRTCESCGKPMPWDSPYKTCKRCYLKQKRKSYYF